MSSETKRDEPLVFRDIDGNEVQLETLVRREPDWAANRIRVMTRELLKPSTPAAKAGDGWIRERDTACEALAEAMGLSSDHPQRNNLCWLAGRTESVVRDYQRLVAELRRHVPLPAPPSPETNGEA